MSQHDYNIANGAGSTVRSDINNALAAIRSLNSGTSAPASTTAYMLWVDTTATPPTLKQRDAADAAWASVGPISLPSFGLQASATLAAHATTCDIWGQGASTVSLSGSAVTFTDLAAAPNAGAWRRLVMNAAHVFTNNADLEVKGGTHTCASGDVVWVYAKTTTTFSLTIEKADGTPVRGVASVAINGGSPQEGVVDLNSTTVNNVFGDIALVGGAVEWSTDPFGFYGLRVYTSHATKEITIRNRMFGNDPLSGGGSGDGDGDGGDGGGSSIHPHSRIEMAGGVFKFLCDVRLGDIVRGENGPSTVLGIWTNHLGVRPLCSVDAFVGTPGHLLRLASGQWGAVDVDSYAKNSYEKKRAVKVAGGVVVVECLIAAPADVVTLAPGMVLRTAGGIRTIGEIKRYPCVGEGALVSGNQEVIALLLSDGHVFYADGYAVSTLA